MYTRMPEYLKVAPTDSCDSKTDNASRISLPRMMESLHPLSLASRPKSPTKHLSKGLRRRDAAAVSPNTKSS